MSLTLDQLRVDFSRWLPAAILDPLLSSYTEIKEAFLLGKHEPAELSGAKLCEVLYRVLELEADRTFTPLGVSIKPFDAKCRAFESKTGAKESVRFHLPRLAIAVYDIRNKRGVGHVGGDVNPNLADATLVATVADWIMAELIRLHYSCSLDQAQRWVDGLVQRRLLLVHEIGGKKRVLNPSLAFASRVLVLLAAEFPSGLEETTLREWTEHSHPTVFRRDVLKPLHKRKLIEYAPPLCTILPPGLSLVDANYSAWCQYTPAVAASRRPSRR